MSQRYAKLQPWYHRTAPRCMATLIGGEWQCSYTSRFQATDGREIYLCKVHSQMVDYPMKPIRVDIVNVGRF